MVYIIRENFNARAGNEGGGEIEEWSGEEGRKKVEDQRMGKEIKRERG